MIVDNLCMIAGFLMIGFATSFELLLLGTRSGLKMTNLKSVWLQVGFWPVTAPGATWCPARYLWARFPTQTCEEPAVCSPWSATPPASSSACWAGPLSPGDSRLSATTPPPSSPSQCSSSARSHQAGCWGKERSRRLSILFSSTEETWRLQSKKKRLSVA